jgi:hypothetical protein
MNRQFDSRSHGFGIESLGKIAIRNKWSQELSYNRRYFLRMGLGKKQNRRFYPSVPKLFAFVNTGNRKAECPGIKAGLCYLKRSVAIAVCFYRYTNTAL